MGKFVRPLPSTPMDDVAHVYGQVAEIVLTLSRLTFPKIGMISGDSNIGSPIVSQCLFSTSLHATRSVRRRNYIQRDFKSSMLRRKTKSLSMTIGSHSPCYAGSLSPTFSSLNWTIGQGSISSPSSGHPQRQYFVRR